MFHCAQTVPSLLTWATVPSHFQCFFPITTWVCGTLTVAQLPQAFSVLPVSKEQSQHLALGLVKSIHNSLGYLVCRGMFLNGYSGPKDWEILARLSVSARICCSAPLAREARDLPMPVLPCQPPAVLCFLWPLRANGHWLEGPPWLWQQSSLCLCLYKLVDLKKPHEVWCRRLVTLIFLFFLENQAPSSLLFISSPLQDPLWAPGRLHRADICAGEEPNLFLMTPCTARRPREDANVG